jgi:ribosomal protein S18 acetylase RimI-like enzyme
MDTPEVMELTRTIWDGEDYVPHVWWEWFLDPRGLLAVAEYGGMVVGLGKLTQLSERDWWMEGLRVHPDFERRGIASHLNDSIGLLAEKWSRRDPPGDSFLPPTYSSDL